MGIVPMELHGAVVTNDFPLFNLRADRLLPGFFGWLCRTHGFVELCQRASEGTTNRVRLKEERFLSLEIPLPPLPEQRRIVGRIEELAAQIQEARTLRQQAAKEAEALLLCQIGKVFSHLETKYNSREFGSFSPHVTSGPRNWAKHYEQNGSRFYRAQDVGPAGRVLEDSKVFITPPPGEQGRTAVLQHGDLMIVITGATVGRVNVYRKGLEPGFVSQHVAICRLPQTEVEPDFALWGLRGPGGQQQLLGQRYGQGKPGLNLTNIRSLSLPFPPLPSQRRIVAELNALQGEVDALKRLQAETAAELDALLPSILAKAFKGEL
jgi:type I restriction enzyme S subunit